MKVGGAARTADDQCVLLFPLPGVEQAARLLGDHARHGGCTVERLRHCRMPEREELGFGKLLLARIIDQPDLRRVRGRPANPADGLGVPFESKGVFAQFLTLDDKASR